MATADSRGRPAATPRNLHYGEFYGLEPRSEDDRPLLVVHGNCQAESLRVLLDGAWGGVDGPVRTARMVPAHELTPDDVPHLHALLERAWYLVTQPIVSGYRGLPVGTRELLEAHTFRAHAIVPVLRWAGLHPTQVIVRSAAGEPPIVPYHDLRTVLEACGQRRPASDERTVTDLQRRSRWELERRIAAAGALNVVPAFTAPGRRPVHVINHPTNPVLAEIAALVAHALGLGAGSAFDPGRVLLGSVIAPVEPIVAEDRGMPELADEQDWLVHGERVPDERIRAAHLEWYAQHPEALAAAVERHRDALALFGSRA